MSKANGEGISWAGILLIFACVGLLAMLFRIHIWFFTILVLSAIVIGSIFYLIKAFKDRRERRAFAKSIGGNVIENLRQCDLQIKKNEGEIKDIRNNLADLEDKIDPNLELKASTFQESERIRTAFEQELKLRQAKINFYETCRTKLRTLEYNHRMVQELARKQEKLNQLQEEHYEEIAGMESMKSGLQHDQFYLESIEKLSLKMLKSTSLDMAEGLQLELVEITKELRKM